VPPNILAHGDTFAAFVEECGGVQSASRGKDALPFAHPLGQRIEQRCGNPQIVF